MALRRDVAEPTARAELIDAAERLLKLARLVDAGREADLLLDEIAALRARRPVRVAGWQLGMPALTGPLLLLGDDTISECPPPD